MGLRVPQGAIWRRCFAVGTVLVMVAALSACGDDDDDDAAGDGGGSAAASQEQDSADREVEEIEALVSAYPPMATGVPWLNAMDADYFASAGYKVTDLISGGGGAATIRAVLSGDLPFAEVTTAAIIDAWRAGSPLIAFGGGLQNAAEFHFTVPSSSALNSIDDLAAADHLRWGFTNVGSGTHMWIALAADELGIPSEVIESSAAGGVSEGAVLLRSGGLDVMLIPEPVLSLVGEDLKSIGRLSEVIPEYHATILVTRPEMVEEQPERVTEFLRAYHQGLLDMMEDPEAAAELWSEAADLPVDIALRTLEENIANNNWGAGDAIGGISGVGLEAVTRGRELTFPDEATADPVPWSEIIYTGALDELGIAYTLPSEN